MSTIKSSSEDLTLNADGAGNDIIFESNGAEKASLTDAGVFTATSFAGNNVAFPATQVASADANTLDDYEEGTWTPTLGSVGTASISVQNGNYTKIGEVVFASFDLRISTIGTGSPVTQISGLPFADGGQGHHGGSLGTITSVATAGYSFSLSVVASTAIRFSAFQSSTTTWTAGIATLGDGTDVRGSIQYTV